MTKAQRQLQFSFIEIAITWRLTASIRGLRMSSKRRTLHSIVLLCIAIAMNTLPFRRDCDFFSIDVTGIILIVVNQVYVHKETEFSHGPLVARHYVS